MITIWGSYKGGEAERIDSATTPKEAEYLLGEYRLAYGKDYYLWIGRKREARNDDAPRR
jgi:hypothetical protein